MTVVRVAVYPIDPDLIEALRRSVDSSLIPLYRQQPGFQGLSLSPSGGDVVSVTRWDTREHAEAGSAAVIAWAKTAPGSLGPPSAIHIGEEMNSA